MNELMEMELAASLFNFAALAKIIGPYGFCMF